MSVNFHTCRSVGNFNQSKTVLSIHIWAKYPEVSGTPAFMCLYLFFFTGLKQHMSIMHKSRQNMHRILVIIVGPHNNCQFYVEFTLYFDTYLLGKEKLVIRFL